MTLELGALTIPNALKEIKKMSYCMWTNDILFLNYFVGVASETFNWCFVKGNWHWGIGTWGGSRALGWLEMYKKYRFVNCIHGGDSEV